MRRTLVAVVESAAADGYDRHAWQLAYLARPFQRLAHDIDDELRTTELAVGAVEGRGDDRARVSVWLERGNALNDSGAYEQGDDWLHRALAQAEQSGDDHAVASVLSSMGDELTNRGQAEAAISFLERSVAAARRGGRPLRLAHSLLNLANAEGEAGRLDTADEHNTEALATYRRHGAQVDRLLSVASGILNSPSSRPPQSDSARRHHRRKRSPGPDAMR